MTTMKPLGGYSVTIGPMIFAFVIVPIFLTENVIWSGFISHLLAFVKMFQKTLMKNVEPTKDTKNAPPLET